MTEHSQYDNIAQQYSDSKKSDIVTYIESPTFFNMIGEVKDKTVLDLACGDGFYTRQLKSAGASRIIGVDISPQMIELALDQETTEPLGIDYQCADAAELPHFGQLDLIVAAFLLHYSENERVMQSMCNHIANNLKPGGRFIAMSENPNQLAGRYTFYSKYGFVKTVAEPQQDGSRITYLMATGRKPFKFNVQYFTKQTYENVLRKAGFTTIKWHTLSLSEEGRQLKEDGFWSDYMDNPPVIGLECAL